MDATRSTLLLRLRDPADQDGWAEFYELYEPFLSAVARKIGLKEHDAEDITAKVLAKCVATLPTFELNHQRGFFRSWLKTVMRNEAISLWRSRQRTRAAGLDGVPEPAVQDAVWDQWDQAHRERVLQFALSAVRQAAVAKSWSCFEQHILEGRAAAEVAGGLGMTTSAVYTNCSRILQRVRDKCAEYDEDLIDEEP